MVLSMENINDIIKKFCDEQGYGFRESYSGRGMYGKECVGINCEYPLTVIVELFSFLLENDIDPWAANDYLHDAKEDSIGLGRILYFPNILCE